MNEPLHDDFKAHGYTKCPMCEKNLGLIQSRYIDDDSTTLIIKEIYPFQKDK
jgi:hypothetical protein